jgi:ABC-type dipeptide/oligopeptide/nickel transport system permease component
MKLRYYVIIRTLLIVPTVVILLSTVFFMMHIIPGDPVRVLYGNELPEEYLEEVRHELGLDRPMYIQYVEYMGKFFRGNLGVSFRYKVPVWRKIVDVYPVTVELTAFALLLSTLMGIPLGIFAALKRDTFFDHAIRGLSLYLYSNPSFFTALLLQIFFGLILGWFPISGRTPLGVHIDRITGMLVLDNLLLGDVDAALQSLRYLFLPSLSIALSTLPMLSRITRASLINVMGEDYINTARATGVPEGGIVYKHALRNALLPVITSVGFSFAWLLGGSTITEQIFGLPGLGSLLITSLTGRDFNLIQGIIGVYAIVVVTLNTFVDIIYAMVDPRVKF